MNRKTLRIALALACLAGIFSAKSQNAKGGIPLSISEKIAPPEAVILPSIDWQRIAEEDRKGLGDFRFAVPVDVNFTTENAGKWTTLADGSRLWQLHFTSKNALGLALTVENLDLPRGGKIFLFSSDGKSVEGAFDAENRLPNSKLFVGFTRSDDAIFEYFEPKNVEKQANFRITKIFHAYAQDGRDALGFQSSLNCNINVNCPQGANWQDQKRGVVRIMVVATEGVGWCSGSLVNNTKSDGTPYVLSAYHCADGLHPDYTQWTFFFNYESPNCATPTVEPTSRSIQGCVLRSGARANDFLLLELNQRVPSDFNAQYLGWSRDSTVLPATSVMIHHPQGDIKKISRENDPAVVTNVSINWSNGAVTPPRSHIRAIFDEGTSEVGSSGAPLFDPQGRIVGQLHGGGATDPCHPDYSLFGWLAKSWDGGGTKASRLKDWLDPLSTNVLSQNGTATPTSTSAPIAGKITTWWGDPMVNQKVFIGVDSTVTDANGAFSFTSIPINTVVNVRIPHDINPTNGVDVVDLLVMRRHILGLLTTSLTNIQLFAGDTNDSGDVDATDLLIIKRLLLGVSTQFPISSWHFVPKTTANDPNFPANITIPDVFQVTFTATTMGFDFIAVKTGDVNGSADGNQ